MVIWALSVGAIVPGGNRRFVRGGQLQVQLDALALAFDGQPQLNAIGMEPHPTDHLAGPLNTLSVQFKDSIPWSKPCCCGGRPWRYLTHPDPGWIAFQEGP